MIINSAERLAGENIQKGRLYAQQEGSGITGFIQDLVI
jgi:hypothetical protein